MRRLSPALQGEVADLLAVAFDLKLFASLGRYEAALPAAASSSACGR
jgi:hypothetical protein